MIYKCRKCKNYVDDRNKTCGICGTPIERKEQIPQMLPVYGRSDEDEAVRHVERYDFFWTDGYSRHSGGFLSGHTPGMEIRQCGNFLYISCKRDLRGYRDTPEYVRRNIYKFDTRQYLEAGVNDLTAIDVIPIELEGIGDWNWGVNREGIWIVSETEEETIVKLFDEQGKLRAQVSMKGGKLWYIYGVMIYYSSRDGRIAQYDIMKKKGKTVWDVKREPYYRELEKIWSARGLEMPVPMTYFCTIAANENYVIVKYETEIEDVANDDSYVNYIGGPQIGGKSYNISCSNLHTGEQTLFYGGMRSNREENGEEVIEEDFFYGPFQIVRVIDKYKEMQGRYLGVERQCDVVGMDLASNEIYFLWNDGKDGEWRKKIYSATIRDFLSHEVEKNKVLCWTLENDWSESWEGYFCGEYYFGSSTGNYYFKSSYTGGSIRVILGRDGSRLVMAPVDIRNAGAKYTSAISCTAGTWMYWGDVLYDGCFTEYLKDGDECDLFAIDTSSLSAERCLHISIDEFKKTKEDLETVQDNSRKKEPPAEKLVADSSRKDKPGTFEDTKTSYVYCTHCGAKLPSNAKFCIECGNPCETEKQHGEEKGKPVVPQMPNSARDMQPQEPGIGADGDWRQESIAEFSKTFKSLAQTTALAQGRIADIRIVLPKEAYDGIKISINWDGYLKNIPKQMVENLHAETEGRFTEYLYRNQAGRTESSSSLLLVREKEELAGRTAGESASLWKEMNNAKYFVYQGYGHMDAIRAIKHVCNLYFQYLREEERSSANFSAEDVRIEYKLKSQ